jgi:thymidylate kinase/thiamine kinase-like enzyme
MHNIQNIFNNLVSKSVNRSESEVVTVQYLSNPDGSIRWIWPSTCKSPYFLKFYHVQGLKANAFALLIKFIFALRLQKLVFKSSEVVLTDTILVNQNEWALFTGTVGPNQKYILYQKEQFTKKGSFTKIAITPQSQKLINNEIATIDILKKEKDLNFHFPDVVNVDNNFITFQENRSFSTRKNQWSQQHTLFLQSLAKVNACEYAYDDFDQKHNISSRIQSLKNTRKKLPSGIIKKLEYLHQSFKGSTVDTHLAHGDFTPWNILTNQHAELYIYDWELSSANYPLGFDFFHFIIQNGVLTQQMTWSEIKTEISLSEGMIFHQNETELYLSYYLLVNVLNYLEVYVKQENWHTQIYWLLETWNVALSDSLATVVNPRELIVLDTFDHLNYDQYSGLKLSDQAEKISEYSDLDILMTRQTSEKLIQFLNKHPLIQKVQIQSRYAMTRLMILTKDRQLLSMDHIHQLKRKSLEYMNVKELLKRPYIDRYGIKKMDLMDSLQFIGLFYGLNNAPIPEKYRKYGHVFVGVNNHLDQVINEQFSTGKPNQLELYKEINKLPMNQSFSAFKNKILYLLDSLRNTFRQKGLVITFSGVDGAGKSTIIEKTKREIEKKLRKKVVVIRHRPSLLPILSAWAKGKSEAEKYAAQNLPRQGNNKSTISSLLRFAYYYTDYIIGQFYIYVKHVLRGDVVLYDRYYFDFINDSLRSNISLPKWFLKGGYKLLFQPTLNFFLYADAQTILSRKKELDEQTIKKLTHDYISLFNDLDKKQIGQYLAIENIHLDRTLHLVSKSIQAKLI